MCSTRKRNGFYIEDILTNQLPGSESGPSTSVRDDPQLIEAGAPKGILHDYICSSPSETPSCPQHAFDGPEHYDSDLLYNQTLPFYQHMLNLQKASLCLPISFNPAPTTSPYLDPYTSALDRPSPFMPLYHHPYAGYYFPHYGSKRKGGQIRFTPQQTRSLESRFSSSKYLSPEDRRQLATQLKLSDRQVKTWFQNRRAKWRRSNNGVRPPSPDGRSPSENDFSKLETNTNSYIEVDDEAHITTIKQPVTDV